MSNQWQRKVRINEVTGCEFCFSTHGNICAQFNYKNSAMETLLGSTFYFTFFSELYWSLIEMIRRLIRLLRMIGDWFQVLLMGFLNKNVFENLLLQSKHKKLLGLFIYDVTLSKRG